MIQITSSEPEHLEQLSTLLSAHAGCVLPGGAVFPDAISSRLHRDVGEFVLDPWVEHRETLVAVEDARVVAGSQLWCFRDEPEVSDSYRGVAELRWFCFWPSSQQAAAALLEEAIERAGPRRRFYLSGDLPGVLVYGIPDAWVHVEELAGDHGFVFDGRAEVLLIGRLSELAGPESPPAGCTLKRGVACSGDAVLSAERDGRLPVRMEFTVDLTDWGRTPTLQRAGALWGPFIEHGKLDPPLARWLWLEAFEWLRLAGCDRVIAALVDAEPAVEQAEELGLRRVARLRRGWTLVRTEDGPDPGVWNRPESRFGSGT
ncbi:MAG TPA: hypothetical protein VIX82_04570 [Solirubrobacteraceae bacterium]